jgi:uncharacterized protein YggE
MGTNLYPTPALRRSLRPVLTGLVVVALAITGLALLSEAFANGGQAVYLAHISASATLVPVAPSLVVTGGGRATAPAEGAVLQLLIVRSGTDLTSGLTANPIDAVIHDIRAAGVVETAIVLATVPPPTDVCGAEAGCSAVRIEVTIDHPDLTRLNAIVDAAREAASVHLLRMPSVGAGYRVADCRALQELARESAVADARARADAEARVLGVSLGRLMIVSEAAPTGQPDATGCPLIHGGRGDSEETTGTAGLTVPPFDPLAAPVATATMQVTLAFAIDSDATPST